MFGRAVIFRRVCAMALRSTPRALVVRQLPVVSVHTPRLIRRFCDKSKEDKTTEGETPPKPESEPAAEDSAVDSIAEELRTKLEEQEQEVKKLTDALHIALAEAENARTIAKKDVAKARDFAITKFAKSLLEVADNFERALQAASASEGGTETLKPEQRLKDLSEGVIMIEAQLQRVFKEQSLERYGEVGEKFDPNFHEAMFEFEDSEKEAGTVGQVIRPGYRLKDRVLRAAQVGTVKAP